MNNSAAAIIMIMVLLPFMLLAMYEKNGQPLEKIVRNIAQVCFIRPKQRPYQTDNFYAILERQDNLDKAKYLIPMRFALWAQNRSLEFFRDRGTDYLYDGMGRNLKRGAFPKKWLDEAEADR